MPAIAPQNNYVGSKAAPTKPAKKAKPKARPEKKKAKAAGKK